VLNAGRPHDALVDAQVSHCSQLSPLRKIIARHSL